MKSNTNPKPFVVLLLIGLLIFLALGAFLCGGAFILAPDGHLIQMPIYQLKNSPFSSFLIPGVLLFTFVGIYPLAIAYCLWKQPGKIGWKETPCTCLRRDQQYSTMDELLPALSDG